MGRAVTLANRKGGSGKTTIAVNLAAALGRLGRRVLLADLDPRCHATLISGVDPYERAKGVGHVLTRAGGRRGGPPVPRPRPLPRPAPLHSEQELLRDFSVPGAPLLPGGLAERFDFVLIDTPPAREDLLEAALRRRHRSGGGMTGDQSTNGRNAMMQAERRKDGRNGALVVDDEAPVRRVIRSVLEKLGYEVHEAKTGEEALALHRQHGHGLVVADMIMPQMGGLALITALVGGTPAPRILAISGGGPSGKLKFLSTARTFPGVATLEKPFQIADLIRKVRELAPGSPG